MRPQQNGVVVHKNRIIQEMASVMLHAKNLPYIFWVEVINIACHIHNCVTIRLGTKVTHYEIWRGRAPNMEYFHVFGRKCYILADRERRRKLDPKSDDDIFLGYSTNSRACHVFNNQTKYMIEFINVIINYIKYEVFIQEVRILIFQSNMSYLITQTSIPTSFCQQ